MADTLITLDFSNMTAEQAEKATNDAINSAIKKAANVLSIAVEAKARELASAELKSTRQQYLDALSLVEIADGVWVVTLG